MMKVIHNVKNKPARWLCKVTNHTMSSRENVKRFFSWMEMENARVLVTHMIFLILLPWIVFEVNIATLNLVYMAFVLLGSHRVLNFRRKSLLLVHIIGHLLLFADILCCELLYWYCVVHFCKTFMYRTYSINLHKIPHNSKIRVLSLVIAENFKPMILTALISVFMYTKILKDSHTESALYGMCITFQP